MTNKTQVELKHKNVIQRKRKDTREYTPINEYKPKGSLVFDEELYLTAINADYSLCRFNNISKIGKKCNLLWTWSISCFQIASYISTPRK